MALINQTADPLDQLKRSVLMAKGGPVVAPPTDDPSVIPPPPQAPNMNVLPIVDYMKSLQDLEAQRAAVPKPDPAANKPKWWERLLGGATAFAAGWNGGNGYELGSNVTNRRMIGAQNEYNAKVAPIDAQIAIKHGNLPLVEAVSRIPQEQFRNSLDAWDASRKRAEFTNLNQHWEDETKRKTEKDKEEERRKSQEDASTPAPGARPEKRLNPETNKVEQMVRTKAGTYMPWTPKTIDEGAMAGDKTATELYNRAHPGKEAAGDKPASKAEFRGVETRKAQAIAKAKREHDKAVEMLSPNDTEGRKQADANLMEALQDSQDAYEAEITALGGTVQHYDYKKGGKQGEPEKKTESQGATVRVREKATGKTGVLPKEQVDEAVKSGKFERI